MGLAVLTQERQGRDARFFGSLFIGRNLGECRHRLARDRSRDAVEQGQGCAPRLTVGAAQALADGIGGGRGRARGQIHHALFGHAAERWILVGQGDGKDARGGGSVEARALVQDRAAYGERGVGQGRAQDRGVRALALPAIDGRGDLDPAAAYIRGLIVERGGEDFVLARAAGSDHGQGFQGLAAQGRIDERLLERHDAGGIAEQYQRNAARNRAEPVEHRAQPGGNRRASVLVERARGVARNDAAVKIGGDACRGKSGVG